MKPKANYNHKRILYGFLICNRKGNALPLVLMLLLIVMLFGGAVAYSTMQMHSITRGGYHDQLAYIAAESALERSIKNLQDVITKQEYPGSHGLYFTGDVDSFLNSLIDTINADSSIEKDYTVKVHDTFNDAQVKVSFQRFADPSKEEYTGNSIRFNIQITAQSDMVDNTFSSYGKKAVAVREYEIPVYKRFKLNGAIYTLGDLLIKDGHDTSTEHSTIRGDIYVFGTGLDITNRMQQYYVGGVCAIGNSILHVEEGTIFTRNLVRAGLFDNSDVGSSNIIVDQDIVAQGIQVFGSNDNIVVLGDAFTFDDIEMNGGNSVIAINGSFYGLNPGKDDESEHDSSSGIINVAPSYDNDPQSQESRIAINGNIFANGETFRMYDEVDEGVKKTKAGHKMESVAMVWSEDGRPLYRQVLNPNDKTGAYDTLLSSAGIKNGFSILWKVKWQGLTTEALRNDWELWRDWVNRIRGMAHLQDNIETGGNTFPDPDNPDEITGYCRRGIAANNTFYRIDINNYDYSDIGGARDVTINVVEKIEGLGSSASNILDLYDGTNWMLYTDPFYTEGSMCKAMRDLMNEYLLPQVSVFSSKTTSSGEYIYQNYQANETQTEFNRIKSLLDDTTRFPHDPFYTCIVRYDEAELVDAYGNPKSLNEILFDAWVAEGRDGDLYKNCYFLVLNFDPDKEIVVDDTVNGIIFSLGKVIIERDGTVNGAIIAAGRGFHHEGTGVQDSSADVYDDGKNRLPRVVVGESPSAFSTVDNFLQWKYAAVEIENGGSIIYPGNTELLSYLKGQANEVVGGVSTNRSIDLFDIFDVAEVSP